MFVRVSEREKGESERERVREKGRGESKVCEIKSKIATKLSKELKILKIRKKCLKFNFS